MPIPMTPEARAAANTEFEETPIWNSMALDYEVIIPVLDAMLKKAAEIMP
jgi:hypothetical protein